MNWLHLISTDLPGSTVLTGATPSDLERSEKSLDVPFPQSLKDLLVQCNGVHDQYKSPLVWSVADIAKRNLEFRRNEEFGELYMPFDSLLFFGEAGNGDQFAFPIQAGEVRRPDIFIWDHETDSRSWFSPNLEGFFRRFAEAAK